MLVPSEARETVVHGPNNHNVRYPANSSGRGKERGEKATRLFSSFPPSLPTPSQPTSATARAVFCWVSCASRRKEASGGRVDALSFRYSAESVVAPTSEASTGGPAARCCTSVRCEGKETAAKQAASMGRWVRPQRGGTVAHTQ